MLDTSLWEKILLLAGGALLAWLLQQYRISRGEDVSLVNEHIKDIEKFRDAAQDYWLKLPKDMTEERASAAKVKAAHAATTLVYEHINVICRNRSHDYKQLSIELYKCATGGTFESLREDIVPERAIETYDRATELIHLLRSVRRELMSLKWLLPKILVRACDFSPRRY